MSRDNGLGINHGSKGNTWDISLSRKWRKEYRQMYEGGYIQKYRQFPIARASES